MTQENEVTPSTTNTAAREVAPSNDHLRLHLGEMTAQEMRTAKAAYRLALAENLTQKQGGEQEVAWQSIETAEAEFLTNLADKGGLADPVPGMLRHCARLIAGKRPAVVAPDRYETEEEGDAYAHGYVDGEDAALRSKQPAASEGDGKPLVPPCDACGGRGCIDHGDTEIGSALFDCEECDGSGLANTSKQAAGEAVLAHEPMVPRKDMKRLYNAYVRLLESGRDRIRDLGGECDGVDVMERNDLDLRHARDVLTTPPRHPADEGRAMQWPRGVLNRDKTLELLISHNEWRRGKEGPQTDPRLLGLALEATIAALQAGPRERGAAGGGK